MLDLLDPRHRQGRAGLLIPEERPRLGEHLRVVGVAAVELGGEASPGGVGDPSQGGTPVGGRDQLEVGHLDAEVVEGISVLRLVGLALRRSEGEQDGGGQHEAEDVPSGNGRPARRADGEQTQDGTRHEDRAERPHRPGQVGACGAGDRHDEHEHEGGEPRRRAQPVPPVDRGPRARGPAVDEGRHAGCEHGGEQHVSAQAASAPPGHTQADGEQCGPHRRQRRHERQRRHHELGQEAERAGEAVRQRARVVPDRDEPQQHHDADADGDGVDRPAPALRRSRRGDDREPAGSMPPRRRRCRVRHGRILAPGARRAG